MGLFDFLKKKEAPAAARPITRPMPGAPSRVDPKATNNFIVVTLDSCRYDSFVEAAPRTMLKLGTLERRWAYASWTAPSHYNLLTGLLPHTSPPNVYASDYYKEDFFNYNRRLGAKGVEFGKMVPGLWFPGFLRNTLGYTT
ncbi:MAG: metalloenzyme, partial [Planctomycetia bacterium]